MADNYTSLIPPYMNFKYTQKFLKDPGNGRRYHRCIGATFGNLHVYSTQQADTIIKKPYRLGDYIVDGVPFYYAYPGPFVDFNRCAYSDVLAIDDFFVQYDPDQDATMIHDKPKIKEQLDCYLDTIVQPLSSQIMYFSPNIIMHNLRPAKIMKRGKVDEYSRFYPIFQLIQQMNFDHSPKLTANRFFIPRHNETFDIELLFKTAPGIYKSISVQFSDMYSCVCRIEFDPQALKREKVKTTFEDNAMEGMHGLERLLKNIKQERDKYVIDQYYVRQ